MYQLGIFCGLRREEINGLEYGDIDYTSGILTVKRAAVYHKGEFIIKPPKTRAGNRAIYCPSVVIENLRQMRKDTMEEIIRLGTAWTGSRNVDEVPVFHSDLGRRSTPSEFNKVLKRILLAINNELPDSDKLPVLSVHELRHTTASILISQGLDPVAVAQRLGHSDASTTLRVYAHSFAESDKKAADILENAIFCQKTVKNHSGEKSKIVDFKAV